MARKWSNLCLVLLGLTGVLNTALAQQSTDPLIGYWRQKEESVYIHVVSSDGGYQAEIVRNDWSPALVGTTYFQNVVKTKKKNSWAGDVPISDSSDIGTTTLKLNRSGELRSRHKPGGRATWVRTDPIEKRY